jgi:hypothetical protein
MMGVEEGLTVYLFFNSFPLFWYMMGVEEGSPIIYQKRGKELKT